MINRDLTRRGVLGLAGAAGASYLMGSSIASASSAGMVYVGWSHTEAGSKPVLEEAFKKYRVANPDSELETVGVPYAQMQNTLLLRKRANQQTDVGQLADRWLSLFVSAGGMHDVDEVFGKEFVDSTYHPVALGMTHANGKRYALPWVTGSVTLVGHAKVLGEFGISEMPKTIDALVDALRKVKKAKPSSSPLGFSTKNAGLTQFEFPIVLLDFRWPLFRR